MAKPNKAKPEIKAPETEKQEESVKYTDFYTMVQKDGGFVRVCLKVKGYSSGRIDLVSLTEQPADVFAIASSQLTAQIRRDLGL